jgi:YHS domain-containing protein
MNLLRVIISLLAVYILYQAAKVVVQLKSKTVRENSPSFTTDKGEELVEDPVCHTYIPVSQAYKKELSGKDYYFCSKKCSDEFILDKK